MRAPGRISTGIGVRIRNRRNPARSPPGSPRRRRRRRRVRAAARRGASARGGGRVDGARARRPITPAARPPGEAGSRSRARTERAGARADVRVDHHRRVREAEVEGAVVPAARLQDRAPQRGIVRRPRERAEQLLVLAPRVAPVPLLPADVRRADRDGDEGKNQEPPRAAHGAEHTARPVWAHAMEHGTGGAAQASPPRGEPRFQPGCEFAPRPARRRYRKPMKKLGATCSPAVDQARSSPSAGSATFRT